VYEKPKRDKGLDQVHYDAPAEGNVYQADVLYMPEDPKTKELYILVVVDMATNKTDAVGLKDKSAATVTKGFDTIFTKHKILPKPRYLIQFDNGGEFKASTKDYFDKIDVEVRYGVPYRSRMQALAEAKNKIIGRALFMRMTASELETGDENKDWSAFLKPLITELNKHIKDVQEAKEKRLTNQEKKAGLTADEPHITSKTILLQVGQKVRVALDKPRSVTGDKLSGNFRATDVRFSPQIHTITNVIIAPRAPPLYQVDNKANPAYTYNQLQTVDDDQEKPTNIKGGMYIVEKILGKKTERVGKKSRVVYLVKWKGYENNEKNNSWLPLSELGNALDLVKEFNKSQK
jgi:hypothetical protein